MMLALTKQRINTSSGLSGFISDQAHGLSPSEGNLLLEMWENVVPVVEQKAGHLSVIFTHL
jgi:hypothetical protein